MKIHLSTAFNNPLFEFTFETDEDTPDLRGDIDAWRKKFETLSVRDAGVRIWTSDHDAESPARLEQFCTALMACGGFYDTEGLYKAVYILNFIENDAGDHKQATILYELAGSGLDEEDPGTIIDCEHLVFDSLEDLGRDKYEYEIPSHLQDYVNWEALAGDLCEFTEIRLAGAEPLYVVSC